MDDQKVKVNSNFQESDHEEGKIIRAHSKSRVKIFNYLEESVCFEADACFEVLCNWELSPIFLVYLLPVLTWTCKTLTFKKFHNSFYTEHALVKFSCCCNSSVTFYFAHGKKG